MKLRFLMTNKQLIYNPWKDLAGLLLTRRLKRRLRYHRFKRFFRCPLHLSITSFQRLSYLNRKTLLNVKRHNQSWISVTTKRKGLCDNQGLIQRSWFLRNNHLPIGIGQYANGWVSIICGSALIYTCANYGIESTTKSQMCTNVTKYISTFPTSICDTMNNYLLYVNFSFG